MAALYYIIAREIDSDPHVLFRMRGLDLAARFGEIAVHTIPPPFQVTYAEAKTTAKRIETREIEHVPETPPDETLVFEEIPHCAELIIALLPSAPPFCDRDFTLVMAEFYHRCAHYHAWDSAEAETNAQEEHYFSRSLWTAVCPDPAPGANIYLDMKDINGNMRRFTPYDAFEYYVQFSSEDGTASYSFLFYLFKFLNLVCS
jgi:hypothetical protein